MSRTLERKLAARQQVPGPDRGLSVAGQAESQAGTMTGRGVGLGVGGATSGRWDIGSLGSRGSGYLWVETRAFFLSMELQ